MQARRRRLCELEGVIGGVHDDSAPVEHENFVIEPLRLLRAELLEQPLAIDVARAGNKGLDILAHDHRQGEALRAECLGWAGDIYDADKLSVTWVVDWGCGAGPALHIGTEVLGAVDLYRLRHCDRRANRVGPDIGLTPAPAMFEMNFATLFYGAIIAARFHDETRRVGQDHHGN